MEIEYLNIKIESVNIIIPTKLLNKFIQNDILTLGDVEKLTSSEFSKLPSVGAKMISLFEDLKNDINSDPERFINEYEKSQPKILPFTLEIDLSNQNFLLLFTHIIEDFFALKANFSFKTTKSKELNQKYCNITRKVFGLNSKKYPRVKMASRYKFETERVRQILVNFQEEVKEILNGKFIKKWNCTTNVEAISIIKSFQKELSGFSVINRENLEMLLNEYGIKSLDDYSKNYLDCLLKVWGFNEFESNRRFVLKNNSFYFNNAIDKDLFFDVANLIVKYLQAEVIPVSFDDIAIAVLDNFEVEDDFIKVACNNIIEVEALSDSKFQISFAALSSINDYAYRVLVEKNKELSYNELLNIINTRLINSEKPIDANQLKSNLKKDDKIMPIGKMGIWSLIEWSPNTDSQKDLILKSMRRLNRPLSVKEITEHINLVFDRKNVSKRSISSNLRNYKPLFLKIKGNKFILAEQKKKYKNDIVETRTPKKKTDVLKSDKIRNKAIEVLKTNDKNKIPLIHLVKTLRKIESTFSDKAIYKVIDANPLDFRKTLDSNGKKVVSLISIKKSNPLFSLKEKYKWNELKPILIRELRPIFDSHTINYKNSESLEDALENFFKLTTITSPLPELNGLDERILPILRKFYLGASDYNDKLNYLKQLATSQEVYLKKLLSFIDSTSFQSIKGFGTVIDKLPRIDPKKNRYKKALRGVKSYQFGQHCWRAYNRRNVETHNAEIWTESEIIKTKVSCIVFMVYATFEYFIEIERL